MRTFVHSLPPELQAATLVLLGLAGAFGLYQTWRLLDNIAWIRAAATARARSASQGYVELSGQAQSIPGPPIIAPLSRRDCLWYEFVTSGFARDVFSLIPREHGCSDSIFHLEDRSGRCIIDPDGAQVFAEHRETWFGDTQRPEMRSFGWKLEWMGWLHRRMQYREQRIEAGDRLYVLGEFESLHEDNHNTLTSETSVILAAWKTDPMRMRQIDTNGDGHIDADEWEAAREEALNRAALKLHAEGELQPLHILRKPKNPRQPFIIAAFTEDELLRRLGWRVVFHALLFIGAVAAVVLLTASATI